MEMTPELIQRFGPLQELGRGACGVVYRLGTDRALKVVALTGDGAREARELEVAQRLRHPHLMPCFEAGIEGGAAWVVMPLASGSLEDLVTDPTQRHRAWRLLGQAARGVAALHEAGIVHRDLKPANILLVDGEARVADFGMARGADTATLTATGTILGTPQYMAPEQARGERASPAADAYALGVLAYELVEGVPPYPDHLNTGELLARVARGQRDPLQRSLAWLPEATRRAIDQALDPDAARRPVDLAAWAEELGELPEVQSDPSREAVTQELHATREAPAATKERVTVAPEARLAPVAPAPPASSTPPLRRGLVAGLLLLGLVIGIAYQGAPPSGPPPIVPPDHVPAPPPPPDADPGELTRHPKLGALTLELEAEFEELSRPFRVEGYEELMYNSARVGASRDAEEEATRAPFLELAEEPKYLEGMLEYCLLVERWLARAREVLPPRQLASDRVLVVAPERCHRLLYAHVQMLEYRLINAYDIFVEARLQTLANKLHQELKKMVGELRDTLPSLLGTRPWPPWGTVLAIRLNELAGRPMVARDIEDLLTAIDEGELSVLGLRHAMAAARMIRILKTKDPLPTPEHRWRLWRAGVAAALVQPDGAIPPYGYFNLLNDWTFLRDRFPIDQAERELEAHGDTLKRHIDIEVSWLEAQEFRLDESGIPVLATWEESRRAYHVVRHLGSLAAGWNRSPEFQARPLGCQIRRRAVAIREAHPVLVELAFDRDEVDNRRDAMRELAGCQE
jgi:hypothetical protein